MSINPWPYFACLLVGLLIGGVSFWVVGTWRVDSVKADKSQEQLTQVVALAEQMRKQIDSWVRQEQQQFQEAQDIIRKQQATEQQTTANLADLQKQIKSINDVAKTLVPTTVKFDVAHQQLLKAISDAANTSTTPNTPQTAITKH